MLYAIVFCISFFLASFIYFSLTICTGYIYNATVPITEGKKMYGTRTTVL
jgi:hypothetical protein